MNCPPLPISLSFWVELVGACNSILTNHLSTIRATKIPKPRTVIHHHCSGHWSVPLPPCWPAHNPPPLLGGQPPQPYLYNQWPPKSPNPKSQPKTSQGHQNPQTPNLKPNTPVMAQGGSWSHVKREAEWKVRRGRRTTLDGASRVTIN